MIINLNKLILEKNKRAWTQGHLAEVCGVSLRTIQRIEKTGVASHETIKALASVFEISIEELIYHEPENATNDISLNTKYEKQNAETIIDTNEKPSITGKFVAITGTMFVLAFVVIICGIFLPPHIADQYSFGLKSDYYLAYGLSFLILLPGIILLCLSIGLHKYNHTWSKWTLMFSTLLFLVFNIKTGFIVFILVYFLLFWKSKEKEVQNK